MVSRGPDARNARIREDFLIDIITDSWQYITPLAVREIINEAVNGVPNKAQLSRVSKSLRPVVNEFLRTCHCQMDVDLTVKNVATTFQQYEVDNLYQSVEAVAHNIFRSFLSHLNQGAVSYIDPIDSRRVTSDSLHADTRARISSYIDHRYRRHLKNPNRTIISTQHLIDRSASLIKQFREEISKYVDTFLRMEMVEKQFDDKLTEEITEHQDYELIVQSNDSFRDSRSREVVDIARNVEMQLRSSEDAILAECAHRYLTQAGLCPVGHGDLEACCHILSTVLTRMFGGVAEVDIHKPMRNGDVVIAASTSNEYLTSGLSTSGINPTIPRGRLQGAVALKYGIFVNDSPNSINNANHQEEGSPIFTLGARYSHDTSFSNKWGQIYVRLPFKAHRSPPSPGMKGASILLSAAMAQSLQNQLSSDNRDGNLSDERSRRTRAALHVVKPRGSKALKHQIWELINIASTRDSPEMDDKREVYRIVRVWTENGEADLNLSPLAANVVRSVSSALAGRSEVLQHLGQPCIYSLDGSKEHRLENTFVLAMREIPRHQWIGSLNELLLTFREGSEQFQSPTSDARICVGIWDLSYKQESLSQASKRVSTRQILEKIYWQIMTTAAYMPTLQEFRERRWNWSFGEAQNLIVQVCDEVKGPCGKTDSVYLVKEASRVAHLAGNFGDSVSLAQRQMLASPKEISGHANYLMPLLSAGSLTDAGDHLGDCQVCLESAIRHAQEQFGNCSNALSAAAVHLSLWACISREDGGTDSVRLSFLQTLERSIESLIGTQCSDDERRLFRSWRDCLVESFGAFEKSTPDILDPAFKSLDRLEKEVLLARKLQNSRTWQIREAFLRLTIAAKGIIRYCESQPTAFVSQDTSKSSLIRLFSAQENLGEWRTG